MLGQFYDRNGALWVIALQFADRINSFTHRRPYSGFDTLGNYVRHKITNNHVVRIYLSYDFTLVIAFAVFLMKQCMCFNKNQDCFKITPQSDMGVGRQFR